jgi:hypothetical protein
MTVTNSKQRLFEMMSRLDGNFNSSLNENDDKLVDRELIENKRTEKKKVINENKLFEMNNKLNELGQNDPWDAEVDAASRRAEIKAYYGGNHTQGDDDDDYDVKPRRARFYSDDEDEMDENKLTEYPSEKPTHGQDPNWSIDPKNPSGCLPNLPMDEGDMNEAINVGDVLQYLDDGTFWKIIDITNGIATAFDGFKTKGKIEANKLVANNNLKISKDVDGRLFKSLVAKAKEHIKNNGTDEDDYINSGYPMDENELN